MSNFRSRFERSPADTLAERLCEPRRFLQVVAGARQVGKTTLVEQVLDRLDVPNVFVSADEPTVGDIGWLAAQWDRARIAAADGGKAGAILALDEVQKIRGWSESVKRLWDEDSRARRPLKVVLLGSRSAFIGRCPCSAVVMPAVIRLQAASARSSYSSSAG
jgi:hypothetical protein